MNDTDRLNWLQKQDGVALISDDAGNWVVSFDGTQNVPDNPPQDISTVFFIDADKWKPSVREAIDSAMEM